MLDTMTATKTVGALCGAMLVFLIGKWVADSIYLVGPAGHADGHEVSQIFAEAVDDHAEAEAGETVEDLMALLATADGAKGAKIFAKCKACHKIDEATNGVGPHLIGIVGRGVASIDGFKYSNPMSGLGGNWDPEKIAAFLANPKKFLPGTKMTFVGLKKLRDRANIIAYFQSLQ